MDKLDELLPCPFCGGEAVMRRDDDPGYPWYVTFEHGHDCLMRGLPTDMFRSFATEAEAIAAWNRRAPEALARQSAEQAARVVELEAENARLREACEAVAASAMRNAAYDSCVAALGAS